MSHLTIHINNNIKNRYRRLINKKIINFDKNTSIISENKKKKLP